MSVLLKLRTLFLALCLVAATSCASHPPLGRQQFLADFDVLWSTLAEDYAYFDGKTTDWPKVRDIYRPLAGAATDKREFVGVLERTLWTSTRPVDTHPDPTRPSRPPRMPRG
jgi:hypothetical protein